MERPMMAFLFLSIATTCFIVLSLRESVDSEMETSDTASQAGEEMMKSYTTGKLGYLYESREAEKSVEFVWQRPPSPKAILVFLHGCNHQSRDFWHKSELCGTCTGLPEEVKMTQAAVQDNYFSIAFSSQDTCFTHRDIPRLGYLLNHVRQVPQYKALPVFIVGASSGGHMASILPFYLDSIKGIVPQIAGNAVLGRLISEYHAGTPRIGEKCPQYVPSLWIHMERDTRTRESVEKAVRLLNSKGCDASEIVAKPIPLTASFFSSRITGITPDVSSEIFQALRTNGFLDDKGYLVGDPRVTSWRNALAPLIQQKLNGDNLVADASPISEVLNVAYSQHEIMSDYMPQILSFFNKILGEQ